MGQSRLIARTLTELGYEDLPPEVVRVVKYSFLDTLGVTLAASTLGEGCRPFVRLARQWGGKKQSTILGFGLKAPAPTAALVNGAMAHALDFEEVHDEATVHPSASTFPAALALAEGQGRISGRRVITALALGNELVIRLGRAVSVDPLQYGWFLPPILGAFGAVVAAGKILELTADQLLSALSLVLCQTSFSAEIARSPQSHIREVRDGFSAQAGVLSALLAAEGITGFEHPLEGEAGVFALYFRGNFNQEEFLAGLGQRFYLSRTSFKPWPSCRGTHAYIQAALELRDRGLEPQQISRVNLEVAQLNRMLCEPAKERANPKTAIGAKFSLPFVVATALVRGQVSLGSFSAEALADEEVVALARKVCYRVNPSLRPSEGVMEVMTGEGKVYSRRVESVLGSPQNPMSEEQLRSKFIECATYSAKKLKPGELEQLTQLILALEEVQDIRTITAQLSGGPDGQA